MRVVAPKLRMWHLLGVVATVAALLAISRIQREVDPIQVHMRALRYAEAPGRLKAAQELAQAEGEASVAVETLIGALGDRDARVRAKVAEALGSVLRANRAHPLREIAKDALAQRLNDRDRRARTAVAIALADLHGDPKLVVPPLIEGLRDEDARVRQEVTRCLDYFTPYHASAQDAIFQAIKDPDPLVRVTAVNVLRFSVLKAKNQRSSPRGLVQQLESQIVVASGDTNAKVRAAATFAISALGIATDRPRETGSDPDDPVR